MLLRIDNTGGKRAVRKPFFCRMRRFFVNDVFLIARALTSFSSSTQVCFLRTSHRNVSFYNVFSTLAHAVDKLSVTLFDVNRVVLCRPFFVCASERAETFSLADSSLFDLARYTELVDECTSFLYPRNVYVVSLSGKNVCSESQLFVLLWPKVD